MRLQSSTLVMRETKNLGVEVYDVYVKETFSLRAIFFAPEVSRGKIFISKRTVQKIRSCNRESLVSEVTLEEIKDVVWSCGRDRALGPDGFSFKASILVNESTTKEFSLERGIRQGDPLSPFLFIIAMEGLHVAMDMAMDHGLFRGKSIGLNEYRLSHLLYADDAIFLGEWDENNIKNLITILNCFYLVSTLRLNLSKSNLHGIGVTTHEVSGLANITGCVTASIPFCYLGLPVGSNMGHMQNWNEMIQRVKHRLSKWKVNFLSTGGGVVNDRNISWVKWDFVLNEGDKGGLGISSLKASNLALFYKWRWRFMNRHDSKWVKLIKSIHGRDGGFGTSDWIPFGNGVWVTIVKVVDQMHEKQIIPLNSMALQLGNGRCSIWSRIKIVIAERWVLDQWVWTWNRSIRIGSTTEHQLREMLSMLMNVNFIDTDDKWKWEFELDGIFSVHSASKIIDAILLTTDRESRGDCISNSVVYLEVSKWSGVQRFDHEKESYNITSPGHCGFCIPLYKMLVIF
nr:RNA-directed DNA polymerase, eukaryota [Tanacetum cinerariifolium]